MRRTRLETLVTDWLQSSGQQLIELAPLTGGNNNPCYRIRSDQYSYVVRIDAGDDDKTGVQRQREQRLQRCAAAAGAAPALLYRDDCRGISIYPYLQGRHWRPSDNSNAAMLSRLAALLQCIHRVPVDSDDQWQLVAHIEHYLQQLPTDDSDSARLHRLYPKIRRWLQHDQSAQHCLCHLDLHAGNLLLEQTAQRLYALDWEYAGGTSPLLDIASCGEALLLNPAQLQQLVDSYGLSDSYSKLALTHWQAIANYLALLWHQLKGLPAPAAARKWQSLTLTD